MTPTYLNEVKAYKIANEASPVHIENVILNHLELLKIAKNLSEEVMTLNTKSGELGEGKCNNLQEMAEELLQYLK